jgi:hypothetical protein
MKTRILLLTALLSSSLGSPVSATASEQGGGPAQAKPVRIALVAGGGQEAVRDVLELAQAKLSGAKNIELLERAVVDRVLAEQKLSLSGLVDESTAVIHGHFSRLRES